MNVGVLYSRIREDEKLLLEELRGRGHEVEKIDVRDRGFDVGDAGDLDGLDVAVNRCLESSRSRYVTRFLDHYDVPVVNPPRPTDVCADKVKGSIALADAGVPTPRTTVAFDVESALETIEEYGYPCVLKPVVGSWGRLIARIDSRSAAEAVLEHKDTLGGYEHKVFYVQEFVEKPGRDLRVVATDGVPVAGMYRSSDHWITNAARGGEVSPLEITDEIRDLVERASDAVGGGLLGVDLMETNAERSDAEANAARSDAGGSSGDEPRDGENYVVHEVNATCEFKALDSAVPDVDVPARIVDWVETKAEGGAA